MAKIVLRDLCKFFGDVRAVDHLNLEIKEGEFVTLLGPSGCGKSTTLNCIAGLERPTSGEILFDDRVVNRLSPKDRDIAMVFQDYALYPHMSVYDNMAFSLQLKRMPKAEIDRRVHEAARKLSIDAMLNRKPMQLSGGQRQRVALGRALVRQPVAFLFDEPLSNLDAALRIQTRTEIKALQQELGITTIYVTHDQEEAMVLSDRIAIMKDGTLQQYDTPEETYSKPANSYVAGFIGMPRMNFLSGRASVQENQVVFDAESTTIIWPISILSDQQREAFGEGHEVLLGVRPEDIQVSRETENADVVADVFIVEPVGATTYLELRADGSNLKVSSDPSQRFRSGERVGLRFAPEKLHWFDRATGARI